MTPENQGRTSNAKISEALELLNEAAREKKDELKDLMANRYSHIKEVMTAGIAQGQDIVHDVQDHAQEAILKGKKKAMKIAADIDKRVQNDPWVYIAGTAAASLLLGYFLGSKRK